MSTTTAVALPPIRPELLRWHHQHRIRVYWEDTDAGGIVFYGNYLKFMERARTEWFSSLGFGQEQMRRAGQGMFIVSETQLRYLRPARLDDVLTVTVTVAEQGRVTLLFTQTVCRGDTLLAEGSVRIAWVQPLTEGGATADPQAEPFRPARIPSHILSALPAPIPA